MPVHWDIFPQQNTSSGNLTTKENTGVSVLPSIPECAAFQDSKKWRCSPVRVRSSKFLYNSPLKKAFSPPRPSGSKSVMDSFIYENWRVYPHGPLPRRAFEDNRGSRVQQQNKRGSHCESPVRHWSAEPQKRSGTRGGAGDQRHSNRARSSCSTVIRGGRLREHEQGEGHALTESSNKIKSLSIYQFYKHCKIDCWTKITNCSVFKP